MDERKFPRVSRPVGVLVTGPSGFIGKQLVEHLVARNFGVRELGRADLTTLVNDGEVLSAPFENCSAVVHLAGRAHVLDKTSQTTLATYRQANRDTTLALARAAASSGVRRFVFVSSIRVNGASTQRPFTAADPPSPEEPYATSKHEAEQGLWKIAHETGMEIVVVRPSLVYGPEVKANFLRLLQLASSGLPLPLGSAKGVRSLISIWNFCDLLERCVDDPNAAGKTLLAADGEDVTLPSLIKSLAVAMSRPCRLFPVPIPLLQAATMLVGKRATLDKLTASLQVDISETRNALNWTPPVSLADGLARTAQWYAHTQLARLRRRRK